MKIPYFGLTNIFSEFKCSMRLALPLVASEAIYASSGFVATIMIADLGKEQLAADALVWSIYIAVLVFAIGIFCAVSIMAAQSFGAKDNIGISVCFKQGLILAILMAIPMTLIMIFTPFVLVWTNQDPEVIKYAEPFLYSLIWVMLPLNIIMVVQQFLSGINKANLVMFSSILAVPIEIFFFYAFLFGKFGLPKVGLEGIGYGLAVSYSAIAIGFIFYLYFSKQFKVYSLFEKWWIIERKFLFEIISLGLPLGIMCCSEVLFFAVVAIMMGALGVTVLAAYQIADQYFLIALAVLFGLLQGVSVRVGNEVGCNNRDRIKLTTYVNIGIALTILSIVSVFYLIFPQAAIGVDIDSNNPHFREVAIEAIKYFPIVAFLLMTDSIRLLCGGALRSLKDTKFQLMISVVGFWLIAFPTSYLLAFKFGFGGVGVWWGIATGLSITGIMLLVRFNYLVKNLDLLALITKK